MLLENVVKEFIYEITTKNYTERTIKGYRNNLNKWCKYCNDELNINLVVLKRHTGL